MNAGESASLLAHFLRTNEDLVNGPHPIFFGLKAWLDQVQKFIKFVARGVADAINSEDYPEFGNLIKSLQRELEDLREICDLIRGEKKRKLALHSKLQDLSGAEFSDVYPYNKIFDTEVEQEQQLARNIETVKTAFSGMHFSPELEDILITRNDFDFQIWGRKIVSSTLSKFKRDRIKVKHEIDQQNRSEAESTVLTMMDEIIFGLEKDRGKRDGSKLLRASDIYRLFEAHGNLDEASTRATARLGQSSGK